MTNVNDLHDAMNGTGAHAGHTMEQVGRCAYCSCGMRVQGRATAERLAAGREPKTWEVVLADGFVSYIGPKDNARERVTRHPGATIRPHIPRDRR